MPYMMIEKCCDGNLNNYNTYGRYVTPRTDSLTVARSDDPGKAGASYVGCMHPKFRSDAARVHLLFLTVTICFQIESLMPRSTHGLSF